MVHNTDPSLLFEGGRDRHTQTWTINLKNIPRQAQLTTCPSLQTNNVYKLSVKKEIVQYLHRAAGSPVPVTWCTAIDKGNYTT